MTHIRPGQAVLFDAVGTLIHPHPPVAEVYRDAGQRLGIELSAEEIASRFPTALAKNCHAQQASSEALERERWRRIVADVIGVDESAVGPAFEHLWNHFAQPQAWRMFDDVAGCLNNLRGQGFRLGIASNFDARLRSVCAGHPPLAELAIYCSSQVGYLKPHAEFFRALERDLQLKPAALTLVGDDLQADHHGATTAGWKSVVLDRPQTLHPPGGAVRIASLSELPLLLANRSPR